MRANHLITGLVTALALGACDDDAYRRFDSDISYAAAEALLARGPRRLDLELAPAPGFMLAHAFQIEVDDELLDDELLAGPLRSAITLDDADVCSGSLALAAPDVVVRFDASVTSFGELDCAGFVARVGDILAIGSTPRIVALRRPAAVPQEPDDAVFFATTLKIDDVQVDPAALVEIELNVSPGNRLACDLLVDRPADCVGAVRLLDQTVAVSGEITEVETEDPTALIYLDVEGIVRNVDTNERALILDDGTLVRFVDATRLEGGTLDDVEARIAAGDEVAIEAETAVEASSPIALVAIEASFTSRPGSGGAGPVIVVTGSALDVEPDLGIVTLGFGTDVLVTPETSIEGDFETLDELDRSLGGGTGVRVEAVGPIEAREPRLVVRADRLRLLAIPPQ